jgi:trans-2,3-dihydro-3-hydroxyanthranilate isomerase
MKQNPPQFGPIVDKKTVSEILEISSADIDSSYPVQIVSTGLPSAIVPLRSLNAVKKCRINPSKFKELIEEVSPATLLVFCRETYEKENELNVRVFSNDHGYPEDAATGSANGNLAGYLLQYGYLNSDQLECKVEQGYEMGRASLLKIRASRSGGQFEINVGGSAVLVAEGNWFLDS